MGQGARLGRDGGPARGGRAVERRRAPERRAGRRVGRAVDGDARLRSPRCRAADPDRQPGADGLRPRRRRRRRPRRRRRRVARDHVDGDRARGEAPRPCAIDRAHARAVGLGARRPSRAAPGRADERRRARALRPRRLRREPRLPLLHPAVTHTEWVASLSPWPGEFGVGRMHELLDALGRPERRYPAVHVVGTNGKSTATRTIAAYLRAERLRVGAYTSPHVSGWHERLDADATTFEHAVARVRPVAEELGATQFETLTAAGLAQFAADGVDVAVV